MASGRQRTVTRTIKQICDVWNVINLFEKETNPSSNHMDGEKNG